MDVEQLIQGSVTPQTDLVAIERTYMDLVQGKIQSVSEHFDEEEVRKEREWIRALSKQFFDLSVQWAKIGLAQHGKTKQMPEANELKKKAREILGDLQKNITDYAECYLSINRFITLLHDEVEQEEIRLVRRARDVKWTHDIGIVVARSKKQRKQLVSTIEALEKVKPLLDDIKDDYSALFQAIEDIHSKENAPAFQRSLKSSYRMKDFTRSKKTVKRILEEKKKFTFDKKSLQEKEKVIKELSVKITAFFEEHAELLEDGDGKLLLTPEEVDYTHNSCVRELQKVKEVLGKYYLPHIQSKIDRLHRQKDKLVVGGTLDSLMVLYLKLIKGIALPLKSTADVRDFEGNVLDHVKYLIEGHFKDVPSILEDAEKSVREFRENQRDFKALEAMNYQEVKAAAENSEQTANA